MLRGDGISGKTLYQQICDYLTQEIAKGEFSYEKPICTERSLIESFGVSSITAKRAINELEQKGVLYRRRGAGSFVKKVDEPKFMVGENKICAALLPFVVPNQNGLGSITQTINKALTPHNCFVSVYNSDRDGWREEDTLERLLSQNISWLVYYPNTNNFHLDILYKFIIKGVPVIILDKTTTESYLYNVVCDNFGGACQLTDHLLSLGHKKIAYICSSGIEKLTSVSERFGGYIFSMNKAQINIDERWIVKKLEDNIENSRPEPSESQLSSIKKHILEFRKLGVTAIECEHDGLAATVIGCCKELNIRVPEDMSICGFDGVSPLSPEYKDFSITSVYQNFEEIAVNISDILLGSLTNLPTLGKKIVIPTLLQINKSTAKPAL